MFSLQMTHRGQAVEEMVDVETSEAHVGYSERFLSAR